MVWIRSRGAPALGPISLARHAGRRRLALASRSRADQKHQGGCGPRSPWREGRGHGADFPQVAAGAIEGGEGGGDFADLAGNVIARGKVRYHGHAVAAVAAEPSQALAALALIEVEYEPLPAVLSLDAALAESAPLIDEGLMTSGLAEPAAAPSNLASVIEMGNGDLEAGFADAALVIERRYHTPTVHQGYIEPHACVGRWGQDDQAMLWCCTQGAFDVRSMTAKVLGQPVGSLKLFPVKWWWLWG